FLTQKYSLLLIIPAGCFLVVFGREFLTVWVGQNFQDPTVVDSLAVVLAVLTVGHCIRLVQHSNFLVLVGQGEHRVFGVLTAVTALLCVASAVFAVKFLGWGLRGIAWCNALPMAIVSGLVLPVYFNRIMKIAWRESFQRVWRPALAGSVPSVLLMVVWKLLAPPTSWLGLLAVVTAGGALTALCGWALSLMPVERLRLLRVLGRGRLTHGMENNDAPPI
ncbi:MAG: hypothetical protein GY842_28710, partial [bacterium]|nr:hypothetical protein [bacterium]